MNGFWQAKGRVGCLAWVLTQVITQVMWAIPVAAQPVAKEALWAEPWRQLAQTPPSASIRKLDSLLTDSYHRASLQQRAQIFNLLEQLKPTGLWGKALVGIWKGVVAARPPIVANANPYYEQGLAGSLEAGNANLLIYCMERYAMHAVDTRRPELALFYQLKASEWRQQTGDKDQPTSNAQASLAIGDLYYQMEDYRPAIGFLLRAQPDIPNRHTGAITLANTLGLCYHRLGLYDSAAYWFQQALTTSRSANHLVWQGIVQGNMGALLVDRNQWAAAMPLLWEDFNISYAAGEKNSAGNTLQRLAQCYLNLGKPDTALQLARSAVYLTRQQLDAGYKPYYTTQALQTMATVLQQTGRFDSALFYTNKYYQLKDTLTQRLWQKRAEQVSGRLAFDSLQHRLQWLMQERKTSRYLRNGLLASLMLIGLIGWLWVKNLRKKQQLQQADAHYQQQLAERRWQHAQEQLIALTRQMGEKNDLVQLLQQQADAANTEATEALRQARLLTESDWLQFKGLFEQVHPGFLDRLRQMAPDITPAEMRYASLLRLQLGAKDMAAMLGISNDAVRKTKSRLRQRLPNTLPDQPLEDLLQKV